MTVVAPITAPTRHSIDDLHRERSRLLDAFVMVEEAVGGLLVSAKISVNAEMLGQRIEMLRKAKPAPQYSKEKRKRVLELLLELEPLLAIRGDIAHGRLHLVEIDGEVHACFINSRHFMSESRTARLMRCAEFAKLAARLKVLAHNLSA